MKSYSWNDLPAYTIRQASWILGIPESLVARGVRQGWIQAVRRRGRLVIPAAVLVRLLDDPSTVGGDA
jgi:hypothetical protein